MKNVVTNIIALLLLLAACYATACVLPTWAGIGTLIVLQVIILIVLGNKESDKHEKK